MGLGRREKIKVGEVEGKWVEGGGGDGGWWGRGGGGWVGRGGGWGVRGGGGLEVKKGWERRGSGEGGEGTEE